MSAPTASALAAHLVVTAGASPEPETAALLAGMMLDRLRYPPEGGAPAVVDRDGRPALDPTGAPKTVESLIGEFRRELPQLFASPPPASGTRVASARALGMTGKTAEAAARHAAEQQRQSRGEPVNPYAAATRNLTMQVMMERNNPSMAAQMKVAAGVR